MLLLNVRLASSLAVETKHIAIIGGGASGIFSAISAAEHLVDIRKKEKQTTNVKVVVFEATSKTLTKVAISGGGRCNVLHDTSKPTSELLNGYPRGKKELTGLLSSRFTPQQAQAWFEKQGVKLKTEPDGRMFPVTDSSQTVIDALLSAASVGDIVDIRKRQKVLDVKLSDTRSLSSAPFSISLQVKEGDSKQVRSEAFDAVILASGSAPAGYQLAQSILEQSSAMEDKPTTKRTDTLVAPVPSLFTMNTKNDISEEGTLLYGLAGVSVPKARVTFCPEEQEKIIIHKASESEDPMAKKEQKRPKRPSAHLQQEGPLLVSHHGVTGPAVLRLSAFGARDFHKVNYRGTLRIHWAPDLGSVDDIAELLWKMKQTNPKRMLVTGCPLSVTATLKDSSAADSLSNANLESALKPGFVQKVIAAIPKRLWSSLIINTCEIDPTVTWAEVNKKAVRKLATAIADCKLQVTGKGTFKEEFVTAGGVSLKNIDMRTMMSKSCKGFFLCGEVINVDGVTGGFNFINCWGTGHVAGTNAIDYVLNR